MAEFRARAWLSRDPEFCPGILRAEATFDLLIVLARATTGEALDTPYLRLYSDETLGWDAVAQNHTVIDVDGGHESMLREPFVESLASALMPYVQQRPVQADTRVLELAKA